MIQMIELVSFLIQTLLPPNSKFASSTMVQLFTYEKLGRPKLEWTKSTWSNFDISTFSFADASVDCDDNFLKR